MADASTGSQLYGHLAALLAPPQSIDGTPSMVILEPAGKDVASLAAGTPEAIEALADLANTIPLASPTFLDSGGVYDDIWNFVLRSAAATGPADDPVRVTLANLINDNRADLELMARARTDVPADTFHPVLAEPRSWLDDQGWADVSFRIGGEAPDPPPATPPSVFMPQEVPPLEWRLIDVAGTEPVEIEPIEIEPPPIRVPVRVGPPVFGGGGIDDPDPIGPALWKKSNLVDQIRSATVLGADLSNVDASAGLRPELHTLSERMSLRGVDRAAGWKHVWAAARAVDATSPVAATELEGSGFALRFQVRVVGIRRPWLHQHLLRISGWSMPGLEPGGISNGKAFANNGLMPVLTTRMLVVRRLFVKANWTDADRARASQAQSLAFGPFTVAGGEAFDGTELKRDAPQVVAWLGQVLPACPTA